MSDRPRFVFDANTLVSAALFKGSTPDKALRLALACGDLVMSTECVAELQEVLSRTKFDRYLTAEQREAFLTKLIQRGSLVAVSEPVQACRDPRDDKYLALARSASATSLVSGDQDLLVLKSFEGTAILSPAEFVASLSQSQRKM